MVLPLTVAPPRSPQCATTAFKDYEAPLGCPLAGVEGESPAMFHSKNVSDLNYASAAISPSPGGVEQDAYGISWDTSASHAQGMVSDAH